MSRAYFGAVLFCSVASFFVVACGSDNSTFVGTVDTEVNEIAVDERVVLVGQGSVVRVNFSFDQNDVFFDEGNVRLVVRLPIELGYRNDSAEIDGPGSDDEGVVPQIFACPNGDTYLAFNLDRFDLDGAVAPSITSNAQLKFTVDGRIVRANVVIEARADEGEVRFGCQESFVPDEQEVVSVR